MLSALLFGQASADAQFFQPQIAGYVSRSLMVSQGMPVPVAPMAGNELSLPQFAEAVPYLVMDAQEESVPDYTVPYALGGVVCGLAVAGVAMRKPNRKTRSDGPLRMSAGWDDEDE